MAHHRLCWVALTCSRCSTSSLSTAILCGRRRASSVFRLHFSKATVVANNNVIPTPLDQQLQDAYAQNESDGVRALAVRLVQRRTSLLDANQRSTQHQLSAQNVWEAAWTASQNRPGVAASMLNAWMASYYDAAHDDNVGKDHTEKNPTNEWDKFLSHQAMELFRVWESHADLVQPDLLTYSLAYAATSRSTHTSDAAQLVLDKGLRFSKKRAGSKRRKALAAARRRPVDTALDRLEHLRALLGNDFNVLQETQDFVVLQKPSGVACYHRTLTTAGKTSSSRKKNTGKTSAGTAASDPSLVDSLLSCNVPLSTLNPEAQGLVHRLDRGTSGCIFLAKTNECHALAVSEFYCRKVSKSYLTLVSPCPSDSNHHNEGMLEIPVDGRPARSSYNIVERFGATADSDKLSAALVQLSTWTGRKHQVRVHCAKGLQAPVVNDFVYGPQSTVAPEATTLLSSQLEKTATANKEQFFLHTQTLSIPRFGVDVKAALPEWWTPTLETLRRLTH